MLRRDGAGKRRKAVSVSRIMNAHHPERTTLFFAGMNRE
jgi:hypothetical protein